ncbi:MAG: HAD family hydrolase [Bacteroidaceae bacterium]|nr:HAD family hydrolase [Bacteroidaceae bacterium]
MQKNIILDYGATIDTPGNHWGKVMWHAYEQAGADITEEQLREAYVHTERYLGSTQHILPTDTFRTTLSKKLRLQLSFLHLEHLHPTLLDTLYSQTGRNISDSRRTLLSLKQCGYTLALVSNFYGNIHAVLHEFRLDSLFTAVVESAAAGIRKPDPRLLALVMQHLNARPQDTIVVGDSLTKDIQPALHLGCTAVWIKGEQWHDDNTQAIVPHHTITSLSELEKLLPPHAEQLAAETTITQTQALSAHPRSSSTCPTPVRTPYSPWRSSGS